MQQEHFEHKSKSSNVNENYENFVQKLQKIVNKNWRKAIYERTRLKNIYNKNRSRDNLKNYERKV